MKTIYLFFLYLMLNCIIKFIGILRRYSRCDAILHQIWAGSFSDKNLTVYNYIKFSN
jgi:hypothetical protein